MEAEKMVHMANQIASFFGPYGHDEAVAATADHLEKFWPKPMRLQLIAYVSVSGAGLDKVAEDAARRLKH